MTESRLCLSRPPVAAAVMLIRRPPAEVFAAIVDPAITTKFWFTRSSGALVAGQRVRWDWEMYGVSDQVEVTELVAPELIRMVWGDDPEAMTPVEWRFTARADNTTYVQVTADGFLGDADAMVAQAIDNMGGFALVLAGLKAWLEHGVQLNLVADHSPPAPT